uniref:Uncharacterized protein n=1 Tax=Hordeum vulgare subsp. vulgare TaxID=112509 RepID=A0A8I7B8G2_HORVV
MAVNTRNAIGVVLLLVVMVAEVSKPLATAEEFCWDKCITRCKGELEVCSPKCIHFCNYQSGDVGYVKWATDKLKEAAATSPEKAVLLKNEAQTYLERANALNKKAETP